jgi:YesN/AraC family two-component response regulator
MSAPHGEVGGEQGPAPAADIATLLLVDDEPENLRVALSMLREHGLEVLVALNGADGLRIAADARPDLVLLDVRMPGLDGIAVCRRLKADAETRDIRLLLRARDRLRADLHRPHGLDELARVVGTNRTTLNRLFQTHLGTTVMGYLREQRLQRARALLTTSTWSLEQISTAVGYQNPGALSRALRARFDTTPTELRKRAAGA